MCTFEQMAMILLPDKIQWVYILLSSQQSPMVVHTRRDDKHGEPQANNDHLARRQGSRADGDGV